MKRFIIVSITAIMLFVGCGGNSKEAKELLQKILQVVGIPYDMVVNICQDSNGNGICDIGKEVTAKIRIEKGDTTESIWRKFELDENGTYILEHYDPTKKILMEVQDNGRFGTKQKTALPFKPKPVKVKQELSILQSLIDNGFLDNVDEKEIKRIKESPQREVVDRILLENVFQNQELLAEKNLSESVASEKNLEYIADGLEDINLTGNFIEELEESADKNETYYNLLIQDADQQTQLDPDEAEIIAETNSTEGTGDKTTVLTRESNVTKPSQKQVADGYIIGTLPNRAVAKCSDGNTYESELNISKEGLITFNNVILRADCNVTIPSGAVIDSNNNGKVDADDKTLNFDMKSTGDTTFITPLTTLMLEKMKNGEDVLDFKLLVKDFNPVSPISYSFNEGKKLMVLMEILKEAMDKGDNNISAINISDILNKDINITELNITKIYPSINEEMQNKVTIVKSLFESIDDINSSKVDLASLFVNISDGGLDLESAIRNSLLVPLPEDEDIFDFIANNHTAKENLENLNKTEKNVADGYIIKLASPAVAYCKNGKSYNSNLDVGKKGLITFSGVSLEDDCNITVPSGVTIDSNNNGILDNNDTIVSFNMKAPADSTFISPLTTLLLEKMEKGEDVSEFKNLVKNFDPVEAPAFISTMLDSPEKTKLQKLAILMEVTKTALSDSNSSGDLNISSILDDNITIDKFKVEDITSNLSGELKNKINAKANTIKDIVKLLDTLDTNTIDIKTFMVNISDGKLPIMEAFKNSVLPSVPNDKKRVINNATSVKDLASNVIKSSFEQESISSVSSYFSTIDSNLQNIFNNNFSIKSVDINLSMITPIRTLEFNTTNLNKVYTVNSLDDLFIPYNYDDYYNSYSYKYKYYYDNINNHNYDSLYQRNYEYEEEDDLNNFKIETNYVSKFEIVDGLDSKFFQISKGNRNIAYIDLKDGIESPTPDNPQDYNHDGIYEVEVRATDVQMLESKIVLLRFKVSNDLTTSSIKVKKGYISKYATRGGLVLDTNDSCCFYDLEREEKSNIIDTDDLDISSISLEGDGSEDFEIIDNKKVKVVADSLDYDNMPIYNLKVVATDINGAEYEQNLTIELWNDNNKSIDFEDREKIENKIFKRVSLNEDMGYYPELKVKGAFVKFEILDELDGKFFNIRICGSGGSSDDSNDAYLRACLDQNSSLNPTYKIKEDKNKDGIYEIKVKATDIQTLESSLITLKFELISSKIRFYNNYFYSSWNDYSYNYIYRVPENTVVEGEVPYSAFHIDKANDINITELYLDGNDSDDFEITTRAIVVAKSLDKSSKSDYNLIIVMKDSTGATYKQDILINVTIPRNNPPFEIRNMNNILPLHRYIVSWYDWWNFHIETNNLAKMELFGEDINISVDLDYYYKYNADHGNWFYIDKRYKFEEKEYPTYLNPKDADRDNMYKFSAKMIDIQSLESKQLDFIIEMLSHKVIPYSYSYYDDTLSKSLESNLSIPAEAPIGGELLAESIAKGFYTEFDKDITLDSLILEGEGSDKFKIVDKNTIILNGVVHQGDEYNLTLKIIDSEGIVSQNPIHIFIDSITHMNPPTHNKMQQKVSKMKNSKIDKSYKNKIYYKDKQGRIYLIDRETRKIKRYR